MQPRARISGCGSLVSTQLAVLIFSLHSACLVDIHRHLHGDPTYPRCEEFHRVQQCTTCSCIPADAQICDVIKNHNKQLFQNVFFILSNEYNIQFVKLVHQQVVIAALFHPSILVSFPRIPFGPILEYRQRFCQASEAPFAQSFQIYLVFLRHSQNKPLLLPTELCSRFGAGYSLRF